MLKNRFVTLLCALIPGAGQMYQGYMKRGLSLILIACTIGLVGWLLEPVLIFLCVVWMYSFFDTLNLRTQLLAESAPEDDYLVHFDPRDRRLARAMLDNHRVISWVLIAFGAFAAYEGVIMNIFGDLVYRWGQRVPGFRALYLVMENLPQVVVCVTVIICGIWLLKGPRSARKASPAEEAPADAVLCEEPQDAAQPTGAVLLSVPAADSRESHSDDASE